jgi:hypothetical protein
MLLAAVLVAMSACKDAGLSRFGRLLVFWSVHASVAGAARVGRGDALTEG